MIFHDSPMIFYDPPMLSLVSMISKLDNMEMVLTRKRLVDKWEQCRSTIRRHCKAGWIVVLFVCFVQIYQFYHLYVIYYCVLQSQLGVILLAHN